MNVLRTHQAVLFHTNSLWTLLKTTIIKLFVIEAYLQSLDTTIACSMMKHVFTKALKLDKFDQITKASEHFADCPPYSKVI